MKKNIKMTVLGGGLWGTVLAGHLGRTGRREVRLWEFFPELALALQRSRSHPHIPGYRLPEAVAVTSDLGRAVEGAEVLLFVLPSSFVRRTARALRRHLGPGPAPAVVNASKGLEPGTLLTMGEVVASELPRRSSVYTLSGPSFAREVARGVATRMVLAGPGGPKGERVRRLFDGGALQVEWSADRKGIELGGSLKNVVAIACGVLDGLSAGAASGSEPSLTPSGKALAAGAAPRRAPSRPVSRKALPVGANTKAALIIQGMAEIGRIIGACGGKPETVYGLAGLGDLIATGTSPESRNRALGEKLGAGKTLAQALGEIPTIVEGIEASAAARALAKRLRIKAPLMEAVWKVVHRGGAPGLVLSALGFVAGEA